MPFVGSEILEVAPGAPQIITTVDDRWVVTVDAGRTTPGGLMPLTGSFTVLDITTMRAEAYTGLPTAVANFPQATSSLCSHLGYAWFSISGSIFRITPSTGAVAVIAHGFAYGTAGIAGMNGLIYLGRDGTSGAYVKIYDPAAGTFTDGATTVGSPVAGVNGIVAFPTDRLVLGLSGSGIMPILDDTGLELFLPTSGTAAGAKPRGCAAGRRAYMPTSTSTHQIVDVDSGSYIGPGATSIGISNSGPVYHSDGWIYDMNPTTGQLRAYSPITGVTELSTLPTARGRRWAVASAGGQLVIPSGEPLT